MGNGISVNTNVNVVITKHVISNGKHKNKKKRNAFYEPVENIALKNINDLYNKKNMKDCAIIFCNSYDNTCYALGDCAKNDGVLAYYEFIKQSYDTFILHDAPRQDVVNILKHFVQQSLDRLVIYYIGHGTQIFTPQSKHEKSGLDSAFVCKDGVISDNDLYKYLNLENKKPKQIRLITDCCHSGTIYDLENNDYTKYNTLSISACGDNETAKQDYICRRGNGVFSYYFWKYYNDNISLKEFIDKVNRKIKIYQQHAETSVDELLSNISNNNQIKIL